MASAALRIFALYVLLEVAAVAALIWGIGFGWTVLVLLGSFVAGLALASGQIKHQFHRLRSARGSGSFADGGLVAAGTLLVVVPGPVTTVAGLLLLAPVTRNAARPLLAAVAVGALGKRTPLIAAATVGRRWYADQRAAGRRADYIDAEFVDVTETGQRALSVG